MSESSPSLAEMAMPKAAPPVSSPERVNGNGRNFTPLPQDFKGLEAEALRDTNAKMEMAIAKAGAKPATAETPHSTPALLKPPPPPEMPEMPQLTASQLAEAREELKSLKASNQGKPEEHAEVEKMLNSMEKQLGLSEKTVAPKVAPIEKRVSSNVAAVSKPDVVAKPSVEAKAESGSKQSLLTKIASIAEKIFSIPSAIWRFLTAWIMK